MKKKKQHVLELIEKDGLGYMKIDGLQMNFISSYTLHRDTEGMTLELKIDIDATNSSISIPGTKIVKA